MMLQTTTFALVLLTSGVSTAEEARRDLYGDPLPQGALMRLGTTRFRHDGHTIMGVVYSPDGKLLATCGDDDCIRLWDARTGEQQRRLAGHTKSPTTLAFSHDGKMLASGGEDETVRLWEVATGKLLHTITEEGSLFSVVFTRDGKGVAAGTSDKRIRMWDTATGKCLRTLEGHKEGDIHLSMSADGKLLASAGWGDGMVCLWDVATGTLLRECGQRKSMIHDVRFAPDGKMLATCCIDGSIHLWDVATGKEARWWKACDHEVQSLAFTRDGRTLLSGDDRGNLCEWHTATGKRQRVLARLPHMVYGLSLAADGKTLASLCWDRMVRRWDLDSGKEIPSPLGHEADIDALRFTDDRTLLSTAEDGTARLWNVADGKQLRCESMKAIPHHESPRIALSADGLTLAIATEKIVRVRTLTTGKDPSSFPISGTVMRLRFAPDGKTLAAGTNGDGDSDTIHLWDVQTGKERRRLAGSYDLVFSADSRLLAASDAKGKAVGIHLWKSARGEHVRYIPPPNKHSYLSPLCFSADGRMLAGWHYGNDATDAKRCSLVVWEVATGRERIRWTTEKDVMLAAAFSPDSKLLGAGGRGERVRLWDVRTGKERAPFRGHRNDVLALAFSKDGRKLASGGADTTILLWSVPQRIEETLHTDKELSTEKLRVLGADLAGSDAARAFQSMKALAANPSSTMAWLRQHLRPVKAIEGKTGERLLAHLDDDDFTLRDQATKELEKLGDSAEPLLRQALRGKPALELRRRAEQLLEKLARETPERLRQSRALELLEWLDTPESRRLLEELAAGAADAWLTREAKAARDRLRKSRRSAS